MSGMRKWIFSILGLVLLAGVCVTAFLAYRNSRRHRIPNTLIGAVVKQDFDTQKQSPIANVEVISLDGLAAQNTQSDFSGGFSLPMRPGVKMGAPIRLAFRHPDFQPLEITEPFSRKLVVVRMIPLHGELEATLNQSEVKITNVLVRYSTVTMRTENVGSAVKTFQVVNTGNAPCVSKAPCSPDGRWKAGVGSASLDAGHGNFFQDARINCIAGPCPFTRIDKDLLSDEGRKISVSVLNWSDTTTFLLQAEVYRSQLENIVRRTYPVIFGRSMNFALPSTAEGPSLEADVNGTPVVFPLGTTPVLSWADCQVRIEHNQAKDYRCELKAGYEFQ
jgi:hypothetical protein